MLTDQRPVMASAKRKELIHRLLAGRCEICEATAGLEVHRIRKLADLNKPGRREKPSWTRLMAMRRRKTLGHFPGLP
ncbi:HNH endonuclease [Nocardia brasiliensis]